MCNSSVHASRTCIAVRLDGNLQQAYRTRSGSAIARLFLLQGHCNAAVPVGLHLYSAAEQELAAASRLAGEVDNAGAGASDASSSDATTPPAPLQEPTPRLSLPAAADAAGVALEDSVLTQLQGQLGAAADGAWQPTAQLLGVGPLLGLWHQLAQLLAPVMHQVGCSCVHALQASYRATCAGGPDAP